MLAACSLSSEKQRFLVVIRGTTTAQYEPGTLTIPRGATVAWQNHTLDPHTVTCDPALAQKLGTYAELPKGAQPWDSGDIYNGQIWSHVFTTPGIYIYNSRRDGESLLGTIVVTA
jgi:plastocyanin